MDLVRRVRRRGPRAHRLAVLRGGLERRCVLQWKLLGADALHGRAVAHLDSGAGAAAVPAQRQDNGREGMG